MKNVNPTQYNQNSLWSHEVTTQFPCQLDCQFRGRAESHDKWQCLEAVPDYLSHDDNSHSMVGHLCIRLRN